MLQLSTSSGQCSGLEGEPFLLLVLRTDANTEVRTQVTSIAFMSYSRAAYLAVLPVHPPHHSHHILNPLTKDMSLISSLNPFLTLIPLFSHLSRHPLISITPSLTNTHSPRISLSLGSLLAISFCCSFQLSLFSLIFILLFLVFPPFLHLRKTSHELLATYQH